MEFVLIILIAVIVTGGAKSRPTHDPCTRCSGTGKLAQRHGKGWLVCQRCHGGGKTARPGAKAGGGGS